MYIHKLMYNELKLKLPGSGVIGNTHVANILVIAINKVINGNIIIREDKFMIIFNVKNYILIVIH